MSFRKYKKTWSQSGAPPGRSADHPPSGPGGSSAPRHVYLHDHRIKDAVEEYSEQLEG